MVRRLTAITGIGVLILDRYFGPPKNKTIRMMIKFNMQIQTKVEGWRAIIGDENTYVT